MINTKQNLIGYLLFVVAMLLPILVQAQTLFSDDFDGRNRKTVGNDWFETERQVNDVRVNKGFAVLRDNARGVPDVALERILEGDFSCAVLEFDWQPLKRSDVTDMLFVSIVSMSPNTPFYTSNIFSADLGDNSKTWFSEAISLASAPKNYPFMLRFWTVLDGRYNRFEGLRLDNIRISTLDKGVLPNVPGVPVPAVGWFAMAALIMVVRRKVTV